MHLTIRLTLLTCFFTIFAISLILGKPWSIPIHANSYSTLELNNILKLYNLNNSPILCVEKSYKWCRDKHDKCVQTKDTSKYHINNCFSSKDKCEKEKSYCYIYDKYYNKCVKYSGNPGDTIHIKDKNGKHYDIKCDTWDKCNKHVKPWPNTKTDLP